MDSLIAFCAQYLYLLVIVLTIWAWLKADSKEKLRLLIFIALAGALALVVSRLASRLYFDPRPFVKEHVKPLIPHQTDNGFPSDHALLTGTLTAAVYYFNRRFSYIMAGLTIIVGAARVLARVHSPLDIISGWAIGVLGVLISFYLTKWFWQQRQKR